MIAKQSGEKQQASRPGMNKAWWLIISAITIFSLSSWVAFTQQPRPVNSAPRQALTSSDWWLRPVERNAMRRLPHIGGNLNGIFSLPDGRHLWAVGQGGMIVYSHDGGQNWQRGKIVAASSAAPAGDQQQSVPTPAASFGISAAFAAEPQVQQQFPVQQEAPRAPGLLPPNYSATSKSPDPKTEKLPAIAPQVQNIPVPVLSPTVSLNAVFFTDASHGWAVGKNGTIIATADGGKTWKPQTSGTTAMLKSIHFGDPAHGWAVGENGTILATEDGGRTWKPQTSGTTDWLQSIHFGDPGHGWAVGSNGTILATEDGGKTWKQQTSGTTGPLTGIHFGDPTHGWAVADNGTIIATGDGGRTWKQQSSGTTEWLQSIHFGDLKNGWAVGYNGKIIATGDGGRTWKRQASGTTEPLFGIHFVDPTHGWAAGWDGTILATADGGNTWKQQASGTTAWLLSIHFVDPTHGWAVDSKGKIHATGDGGRTWKQQDSGRIWLESIHFVDPTRGWAVGGDTILATEDGGSTWKQQTSNTTAGLEGIHFVDPTHGWAVGRNGTIIATGDGGNTWKQQASGTSAGLYGIHFRDPRNGWAAGDNGTIIATEDGGRNWADPLLPYRMLPAPWYYPMLLLSLALFIRGAKPLVMPRHEKPVRAIEQISATDRPADPADPASRDYLGAHVIAQRLSRFLTNRHTSPPITLAITGDWGSGKSSIMNYLFAQLRRDGLRPVWFNAWHHREEANVLASILENVQLQAVQPWRMLLRLRLLLKRHWIFPASFLLLAAAICYFGAAFSAGGHDFTSSLLHTFEAAKEAAKKAGFSGGMAEIVAGGGSLGLIGGLVLLWFKFTAAFGNPLKLLKSFLEKTGAAGSAEPSGFRLLYERRFRHITELLGRRRLVLFIDDLDRCEREYTMRVLETTNFLASSGELFIVLGMAPHYVLANVNMHFKELASAVHEQENENGRSPSEKATRISFARRYLQKLINIEVPVPRINQQQVLKMLTNAPAEPDNQDESARRVAQWLRLANIAAPVLLTIMVLALALWAGSNWQTKPQGAGQGARQFEQAVPASIAVETRPSARPDIATPNIAKPPPDRSGEAFFRAGADTSQGEWQWSLLFAIPVLITALTGWLLHADHEGRSELIVELARRMRVWLNGPEQTEDSDEFAAALRIWHELLVSHDPTPRTIKAFQNRLRYFSSRIGENLDKKRQAHLVALSVANFACEDTDWALGCMAMTRAELLQMKQELEARPEEIQGKTGERQQLFLEVLLKHLDSFGSLPDEHDREIFRELVADIEIHRQE